MKIFFCIIIRTYSGVRGAPHRLQAVRPSTRLPARLFSLPYIYSRSKNNVSAMDWRLLYFGQALKAIFHFALQLRKFSSDAIFHASPRRKFERGHFYE
jgi:hypothetical protein